MKDTERWPRKRSEYTQGFIYSESANSYKERLSRNNRRQRAMDNIDRIVDIIIDPLIDNADTDRLIVRASLTELWESASNLSINFEE